MLRTAGISDLSNLNVFEVGCGLGDNLLHLIRLGANPEKLTGSDIIEERINTAKKRLPISTTLIVENSSKSKHYLKSFDLILQFTVFSLILDEREQAELAQKLMSMLTDDGYILWYDFLINNPKNSLVRGCSKKRISQLFPHSKIIFQKVTLAPPLNRLVVRKFPFMYSFLNFFRSFARIHLHSNFGWLINRFGNALSKSLQWT